MLYHLNLLQAGALVFHAVDLHSRRNGRHIQCLVKHAAHITDHAPLLAHREKHFQRLPVLGPYFVVLGL